ncbi:hypothetical protein GCM10022247_21340 [Allokutzneria multivorans]|uniref:2TM domain-containing protein n=2 Tax=Allokutzneria multivorans TaxID=1142134 RepID=A0ABP7RPS3_9PSEU
MGESMRTWLGASLVMIAVWTVTGLVTGGLGYPWFVWPVSVWGALEVLSWAGDRHRERS